VRLTGIRAFRINGTDGTHRIRQIAAVRADATTQDGRIAGTRWSGFDRVLDGGDPSIVLRGNEATRARGGPTEGVAVDVGSARAVGVDLVRALGRYLRIRVVSSRGTG